MKRAMQITLSASEWLFVLVLAVIGGLVLSAILAEIAERRCKKKKRQP